MTRSFAIGWRQVGASMVIMACAAMVASTYGIIAVPLAEEFQPSRMVLMLAMTIMALGSAIAAPICGDLMDRISLRTLIGCGIALLVGGYVALSFATSFAQVLIIFGLFFAAANILAGPISATVLLTRWFDKRRGAALGIAISGVAGGTMFFPPLVQFLLDSFTWREALRVLALILFLLTVPALALLVNRPEDRGLHPDGAEAPPANLAKAQAGQPAGTPSLGAILRDPSFWLLGAVNTIVLAGMMGTVTNLVPMAVDYGIAPHAAALVVSVYAGTGFIGKLLFAVLADRMSPRTLMFAVLALFAAGMAGLAQAGSGYGMILASAALVGIGGMMIPLKSFIVPRIFGAAVVGRVYGLLSFFTLWGLLATPPLFGFIFDRTGSYSAIFLAYAGFSVLAMLLIPRIRLQEADSASADAALAPQPAP
ncbi:MAG: MFS transporter [Novosphingobium sp.]